MGINVRASKSDKNKNIPKIQVSLEKDLKNCMRCRYFHGNNHLCILNNCVKDSEKGQQNEPDEKHICFQCPYKRNDNNYCFPCMKKILGFGKDKLKNEEMEE